MLLHFGLVLLEVHLDDERFGFHEGSLDGRIERVRIFSGQVNRAQQVYFALGGGRFPKEQLPGRRLRNQGRR